MAQRYFTVEIVEPLPQEPFLRNGFTCIGGSVLHRFIYKRSILKNERGRVCIPATLGLWPCVYVPPLSQIGASEGIWTLTGLILSQLTLPVGLRRQWWAGWESNPHSWDYESLALSLSYPPWKCPLTAGVLAQPYTRRAISSLLFNWWRRRELNPRVPVSSLSFRPHVCSSFTEKESSGCLGLQDTSTIYWECSNTLFCTDSRCLSSDDGRMTRGVVLLPEQLDCCELFGLYVTRQGQKGVCTDVVDFAEQVFNSVSIWCFFQSV